VTLAGEKAAVTPCGAPLIDKATGESNPFNPARIRVNDVELPTLTLAPDGVGVRVKFGAATVSANATVRLNPPPVPVTAMGQLLATTLASAVTVIVTWAAGVRAGEENATVTPGGAPAADSVTGELNPPCALIVRVAVAELLGETVRLEEVEARAKFEARMLLQPLTSRNASIEPSPVTIS
jgi:hypothetical protein